jgi:hypothetical protein
MQDHRLAVPPRADQKELFAVFDGLQQLFDFGLAINDFFRQQLFSEPKWILCHRLTSQVIYQLVYNQLVYNQRGKNVGVRNSAIQAARRKRAACSGWFVVWLALWR